MRNKRVYCIKVKGSDKEIFVKALNKDEAARLAGYSYKEMYSKKIVVEKLKREGGKNESKI